MKTNIYMHLLAIMSLSLGFHSVSKNRNGAASQVFVGKSGFFDLPVARTRVCCRLFMSPMLRFTRNTFSTKEKGWKDEVSLRNSRISGSQIPVRIAPQHWVTKVWGFLHIFLCVPRIFGTNANKPFLIFTLRRFSLQCFHPASPCTTQQGYNH